MKKLRTEEIKQKLREISDSIATVEEALPTNLEDFINLGLIKDGIYKKIEFAIENVIDICVMLNADLSLGVPSDDSDAIKNLEKHKILRKVLANKIHGMKSFRNILVHRYGKIDDEIAFEILNEHMPDFEDFRNEVLRFLNKVNKK